MFCKKRVANLLHCETKTKVSCIPLQKVITGKTVRNDSKNKFESEVPKKKRRKSLKNIKRKYSTYDTDTILSDKSESKNDLSHESFSSISSDIEISINSSCEVNWVHEIEPDITPSKSERDTKVNSQRLKVDTVYHTDSNNTVNNILSTLEDSFSECYREAEDLILSNTSLESLDLKNEKLLHTSCYDMKEGKILVIKDRNPVYLHGSFIISVLYGKVQILGHNLTPSNSKYEIYSLRGFSYLCIENIHQGEHCTSDDIMKNKLRKSGVSKSDVLNIFSEMKTSYCILICTAVRNLQLHYIEKHLSQKLLPATEDNFPMIVKDDISNLNTFVCNPQWDDIVTMIDSTSKVMICGGKGVGKSTLLRYIMNKVLMNYREILVIDLDPGQSEFTIPGCISAVIVRKPIFGPNFTHLHEPERCIFIGNVDITLEPDIYVNNVIELLKQCEDLWGIPTLINYMGYSHSYGLNIASSIITYVSPTILLQINSRQKTKNFTQNLTPDTVIKQLDMFGGSNTRDLFYETVIVDSMSDGLTSWQAQGRTVREMCVLSYFSTMLDNTLVLTSKNIPLYKISLKDITLINSTSKSCINKLSVFNANLVSLCTATNTENIYNCHGWGIVRGIDEEILVLITPVSEDILEIVTHLAVGSVTLPPSILMYEDTNVGLIPYVSLGCISTFNYVPKRSYLPRKHN